MGEKLKKKILRKNNNQQLINKLAMELWDQKSQTKTLFKLLVIQMQNIYIHTYIYIYIYQRVSGLETETERELGKGCERDRFKSW